MPTVQSTTTKENFIGTMIIEKIQLKEQSDLSKIYLALDRLYQFGCIALYQSAQSKCRSNRPEVFLEICKEGVLRNFAKFTGKHLCQSLFFNKVAGLSKRYTDCSPLPNVIE